MDKSDLGQGPGSMLQAVSHEEERVARGVDRLAAGEVAPSIDGGNHRPRGPEGHCRRRPSIPPREPSGRSRSAFLVVHDAAAVVGPTVRRQLRDLSNALGPKQQTCFLVGCEARVPEELEKEVTVIDIPLPGREDVGKLLAALLKAQAIEVPTDRFWRFVDGCLGLTEREIKRLLARIMMVGDGFAESDLSALVEEKRQAIRRSRYLEFWEAGGSVNQVGGLDALKGWLEARGRGFTDEARQFGLPQPKGLFLLGVQGCGKSLMAKAVADMWRMPLLRLDVAAVFSSAKGEDESLRATIRVAEGLAPVVLWIDELEKGFMSMAELGGGQAFGNFLTWMQEKDAPVFVVATANDVRQVCPGAHAEGTLRRHLLR